jgi:hypothetical protein
VVAAPWHGGRQGGGEGSYGRERRTGRSEDGPGQACAAPVGAQTKAGDRRPVLARSALLPPPSRG